MFTRLDLIRNEYYYIISYPEIIFTTAFYDLFYAFMNKSDSAIFERDVTTYFINGSRMEIHLYAHRRTKNQLKEFLQDLDLDLEID